jgi:cation:H+ antiporter
MSSGQDVLFNVILLVAFLAVLNKASRMAIDGSIKISENSGLRASTVGFIFLAMTTSLPEVSVSIASAQSGQIGLAVGNVIGSNIANVSLVIGIPLLLQGIRHVKIKDIFPRMDKIDLDNLFFGLLIASAVPLFLLIVRTGIPVGVTLLALFVFYSFYMSHVDITSKKFREEPLRGRMSRADLRRGIATAIVGVVGVVFSAQLIVSSAGNITSLLGVSQTFVGATVIAVGTSLPELVLSIRAMGEKRLGLALGTAVGSNFANITVVLGMAIALAPFQLESSVFLDLIVFSLFANIVLWYFLSIDWIEWKAGVVLLSIYIIFLTSIASTAFASPG